MKLFLIFLISFNLYGAGFWTLTGLSKANIYVKNGVSYLKPETLKSLKIKMKNGLEANNIKTTEQDSATLMLSLEEIVEDETHYVYIRLEVGEEAQTFREDKTASFVISYSSSDFIEVDMTELDSEILESVDFLISLFSEQYEDDKD